MALYPSLKKKRRPIATFWVFVCVILTHPYSEKGQSITHLLDIHGLATGQLSDSSDRASGNHGDYGLSASRH
jgi:hypothetical protein